jgi:hypothetical protein
VKSKLYENTNIVTKKDNESFNEAIGRALSEIGYDVKIISFPNNEIEVTVTDKNVIMDKDEFELVLDIERKNELKRLAPALLALSKVGRDDGKGCVEYAVHYARKAIRVIASDKFAELTNYEVVTAIFGDLTE